MIRRTVLVTAVLLVLAAAPATAATTNVDIHDLSFPAATSIGLGDTVTWTNQMTGVPHTSTGDSPLALWSKSLPSHGSFGSVTFTAAGTYGYHCSVHPTQMIGKVVVPMAAVPASGSRSTAFSIRWGTLQAPTGFTYIVQRKAPGKTFVAFKSTTAKQTAWTPASTGTWGFRARLKRTSNGAMSDFSPVLKVTVTS